MPALLVALSLTLTRGAWVGVAVGVAVLLLSKDFRLLALIPIVVGRSASLLAPQTLTDRVYSIFDRNDLTSRDRVAMLQAGVAIVKDYPLIGVGPDQIERVYPRYRVRRCRQADQPAPAQRADADRGRARLAGARRLDVVRGHGVRSACCDCCERRGNKSLAAAALGGMAAMLAAGLTEYNFGDSEFLMLLLVMITLPFAANRDGGLPS